MNDRYNSRFEYMQDCETICSIYFSEYMERVVAKRSVTATPYEKYKGLVVSFEEASEGCSGKLVFSLSEGARTKVSELYGMLYDKVEKSDIFIPLEYIARMFNLKPLEKIIVAAGYLPLFNQSYEKTYGYLNDNVNKHFLALNTAVDIFAEGNMTVYQQIKDKAGYLFESQEGIVDGTILKPCKRIGCIMFEGRLVPEYSWITMYYPTMKNKKLLERPDIEQELEELMKRNKSQFIGIMGEKGSGRKSLIRKAAGKVMQPVMFVDFKVFVDNANDVSISDHVTDMIRELLIQQCFICLHNIVGENYQKLLKRCLDELVKITGTIFICIEERSVLKDIEQLPVYYINVPGIERTMSLQLWNSFEKPMGNDICLQEYANKYSLTPGEIKRIVEYTDDMAELDGKTEITREMLDKSCNTLLRDAFDEKAVLIEQKFTLDDLILPQEQKQQIKEGLSHILYRNVVYDEWGFEDKLAYGKGLNILFAGPPGTGKTMAAGIVGRELGLPVYKVDISRMVSKYIGETEKSLGEIFDIAAKNNSILFFDEMDSLFGKRSEVKDSHDKYANIETSYLLQKLEDYEGIVLMSTNFQQNIDEAFIRRINYIIQFPMPDVFLREQLWRNMFTAKMPVDDNIDYNYLANQFVISGAAIKSIVMSAAFMAAESGSTIGMYQLLRAVKKLMQKQGKIMLDSDFGHYSVYLHNVD